MIREQSSAISIPWRLTECRSFWCLIAVCAFIAWMIAAIWPGTAAGSNSWRAQSCAVALHMVLILMTAGDIEQPHCESNIALNLSIKGAERYPWLTRSPARALPARHAHNGRDINVPKRCGGRK